MHSTARSALLCAFSKRPPPTIVSGRQWPDEPVLSNLSNSGTMKGPGGSRRPKSAGKYVPPGDSMKSLSFGNHFRPNICPVIPTLLGTFHRTIINLVFLLQRSTPSDSGVCNCRPMGRFQTFRCCCI